MRQLHEVVSDTCDLGTFKNIPATLVEKRKREQLNNEIRKPNEALTDSNGKVSKRYLTKFNTKYRCKINCK